MKKYSARFWRFSLVMSIYPHEKMNAESQQKQDRQFVVVLFLFLLV